MKETIFSEKDIRELLKTGYSITKLHEAQKDHGYMWCDDCEEEMEVCAYWARYEDGRTKLIHVCPGCANILDDI